MSITSDDFYEEVEIEAIVVEKLADAMENPGFAVEFDPDEADIAGAFQDDALSIEDAQDSSIDILRTI